MTESELFVIEKQFEGYVASFKTANSTLPPPLQLKKEHCKRVAAEAQTLSADLEWALSEQILAEAIGLLHDIGRFSQFSEFNTFSDAVSIDHGERGAAVMNQLNWLSKLPDEEHLIVIDSIRYHNRLAIPDNLSDRSAAFLRLVRDADKLDIIGIVLNAMKQNGFSDLPTMLPNIAMDRTPSQQFIDEIARHKRASLNNVNSLADFLLMQLSWVYDLNYPVTLKRFYDRNIPSKILKYLNNDIRIQTFEKEIYRYIINRIHEANQPYKIRTALS
ncbi:MAG: HD domain-containing protein [Lentisphaerae bacterium]|nr:HD domain-containing protein [Lentisphaerota bacterium]